MKGMRRGKDSAPFTMDRIGKVSESGREFDIEFWQRQGSRAIFAAAWQNGLRRASLEEAE